MSRGNSALVREYLETRPDKVHTTTALATQLGFNNQQISHAIHTLIKQDAPVERVSVGAYRWNSNGAVPETPDQAEVKTGTLFEVVKRFTDGRVLLACENGDLWVARKVEIG